MKYLPSFRRRVALLLTELAYRISPVQKIESYYISEDVACDRPATDPSWSVYGEQFEKHHWVQGGTEPIDGSQYFVCTTRDERTAYRIANALFKCDNPGVAS